MNREASSLMQERSSRIVDLSDSMSNLREQLQDEVEREQT